MRFGWQLALVLSSAAILPLCFPPLGWWPLTFLVFPPLFKATTNTTARRAFYFGLLHGMVGYGAALHWFFHIFGTAAVPLFAILAFFTAIFCVLLNYLTQQTESAFLKVLLAATVWTGIEFYRSELFFLRFPWITTGSAIGPTYLSPILGVYGTSFLIVAASAGFLFRKTLPSAIAVTLGILGLGLFRPAPIQPAPGAGVAVTVVQSEDCVLDSYKALTLKARKESPDLVVWPEYSLPYDVRKNSDDVAALEKLCGEMNAMLVLGTKTTVGSGGRNWYNTALVLDKDGVLGEYYKVRPVHFFNDGIPGHSLAPIQTGLGTFATPICFDCDFSEVVRKMVRLGAEYFVAPSFDARSWSAAEHLQHALLFRLRAAETARWFACAASSGVSQIIDPHGVVHKSLPPMATGAVTSRIGKSRRMAFFVRVGWLFPWFTLGCTIFLVLRGASRRMIEKRRKARAGAEAQEEPAHAPFTTGG